MLSSCIFHALKDDHLAHVIEDRVQVPRGLFEEHNSKQSEDLNKNFQEKCNIPMSRIYNSTHDVYCKVYVFQLSQINNLFGKNFQYEEGNYPVVCKFLTIKFLVDAVHISKQNNIPSIKGELFFAAEALNVTKAFIVDKHFNVGVVDYLHRDENYVQESINALNWVKEYNNSNWCIDPPERIELYPNMKAKSSPGIYKIKKQLAYKNKEITLIRNVGRKNRDLAVNQGITRWDDPRLNSNVLRLNRSYAITADKIITANNSLPDVVELTELSPIPSNIAFLDIETLGNIVDPSIDEYVFMIGISWTDETSAPIYECLTVDNPTVEEEKRLFVRFNDLIRTNKLTELMHWGAFEETVFHKVGVRHHINFEFNLTNMNPIVMRSDFFPKYAFDYSLKSIAPAMHRLNMISTIWDSECTDGLDAQFIAMDCYKNNLPLDDIIRYNYVDVIVIKEMYAYLQHCYQMFT